MDTTTLRLSNPEDRAAVANAGSADQVLQALIRLANDYRGVPGYESRVAELDAAMDAVDTVSTADLDELSAYVQANDNTPKAVIKRVRRVGNKFRVTFTDGTRMMVPAAVNGSQESRVSYGFDRDGAFNARQVTS